MRGSRTQMNTCSAAACGGSFRASMASILLIIAGIAFAVSVLFAAPLTARLCALVLVCLSVSIILLNAVAPLGAHPRE